MFWKWSFHSCAIHRESVCCLWTFNHCMSARAQACEHTQIYFSCAQTLKVNKSIPLGPRKHMKTHNHSETLFILHYIWNIFASCVIWYYLSLLLRDYNHKFSHCAVGTYLISCLFFPFKNSSGVTILVHYFHEQTDRVLPMKVGLSKFSCLFLVFRWPAWSDVCEDSMNEKMIRV